MINDSPAVGKDSGGDWKDTLEEQHLLLQVVPEEKRLIYSLIYIFSPFDVKALPRSETIFLCVILVYGEVFV